MIIYWPPKLKIIFGCESRGDAKGPYMSRWEFFRQLEAAYLHLFHRSDADEMHDHPWDFWTLVIWRGYIEHTPQGRRRLWPGMVVYRRAEHIHRVELIGGKPAVTLVWRGPYRREWGFYTPAGWQQWQAYFTERGC